MSTRAEIKAPRLAAFGPPVWAYKPVTILGVQIASAVVVAFIGLAMLALPVIIAFTLGGQLDAAAVTSHQVVPSSGVVSTGSGPVTLPVAYTR